MPWQPWACCSATGPDGAAWESGSWPAGSSTPPARGAFALNLAYLYFEIALEKTGAGWWSEGTAVFFALKDFTQAAALGTWAVEHLPLEVFRVVTHAVLAVEFIAPLLLLSPWWRAPGPGSVAVDC